MPSSRAAATPTIVDPLSGSRWSRPETVCGFVQSPPNQTLMRFAADELRRTDRGVAVDLGCGAGRNTIPLAGEGWKVLGIDLSLPMVSAASERSLREASRARVRFALAPMDRLPIRDRCADLVVAHGIWNLARSAAEFRTAIGEAARIAKPGAGLFVFTFSRTTLPLDAVPVADEPFVFTQFAGEPQCFLTAEQLIAELAAAGFAADEAVPLRELNRPDAGALRAGNTPVIYEGTFRRPR